ncbi:MAG: L,D-transpeptidase family protein [Pseudomonadota bacterium]
MSQLFPAKSAREPLNILRVRPAPGEATRGIVVAGAGKSRRAFPCALGRSGIGRKRGEGDGITPLGQFRLITAYWRPDKVRVYAYPLPSQAIFQNSGWCDEPGHPRYNRPVRLPFGASHERMWREDHLYDVVIVLDHNQSHHLSVGGSAIFFHLAREDFTPTEGCVAVSREAMEYLLPRIDGSTVIRIG